MTKINNLRLIFLLALPIVLSACSDTDDASEAVKITMEQGQLNSESLIQEVIKTKSKDKEVHLQDLMHHVAQAKRHAEMHGFVWSTTDALVDKGYAEAKKGNEKVAKTTFQEAKLQFELSMEQAKYAAQHWQLLVPESD